MKKLLLALSLFSVLGWSLAYATPLSWTDNSSIETGFLIFRADSVLGPFAQVGQVAANVTTYDDAGGVEGQCYYVVAITTNRNSEPSNISCAKPNAPTGLTAN